MDYLKFLRSRHVPDIMGGSVVFTRLSYFRLLEFKEKRRGIGDKMDGSSVFQMDGIRIDGNAPMTPARVALEKSGFDFGGDSTIDNSKKIEFIDCYVFSCSLGCLARLSREFCSPEQADPYDACIRLRDPHELTRLIKNSGSYRCLMGAAQLSPRPVNQKFQRIECKMVSYGPTTFEASKGEYGRPGAFLKDSFFKPQSEIRIIMTPAPHDLPDRILVNFPIVEGLLSCLFQGEADLEEPSVPAMEASSLLDRLKSLRIEVVIESKGVSSPDPTDFFYRLFCIYWDSRSIGIQNIGIGVMFLHCEVKNKK